MKILLILVGLVLAIFPELQGDTTLYIIGVTHLMYYSSIKGQWDGTTNAVFDLDDANQKLSAHTNYIAGGVTIGSPTLTRSTGTVTYDAADVVWTTSGTGFSNARKFVLYKSTGTASTSRLFSVITADNDVGNVTGDLTIQWNASGIATWSTT